MSTERISVEIIGESDKALRVKYFGETAWIPRSQIQQMTRNGAKAEIVMPHWLYEKKFEGESSEQ